MGSATDEVAWFRMRNQELIDAWTLGATFYGPYPPVPDEDYFVYGPSQRTETLRLEYLATTLEVSAVGDAAVYLLNPQVATSAGEWEAWFHASWLPGAVRYCGRALPMTRFSIYTSAQPSIE